MKYRPLRDLLVITLEKEQDEQTETGIFLSKSNWHEHKPIATVVAVGSDVQGFIEGQRVLINPYAVIDMPGVEEKIIKESDILAHVQ